MLTDLIYSRRNSRVFFLLPSVACGFDEENMPFFEIAFLCFAIGIGANNAD